MKVFFMLMFIAYCNCIIVKTTNSNSDSGYWEAKARETEVDTAISIIVPAVLFGIPIVVVLIAALIIGFNVDR